MEQIKVIQTQAFSSISSSASGSLESPALAPTAIYEWLIADEVLRVHRGH